MTTIEHQRHEIADKIIKAVQSGHLARVDDLAEALVDLGRQAGKDDLIIELWDGQEIDEKGLEFAIENSGTCDPRH